MKKKIQAWLREPMVHFLVIGLAIFVLVAIFRDQDPGVDAGRQVRVTAVEIQWLRDNWQSRWQRPPTERELRGLVNDYVRQELLYREALAMGLDRDDEIIRRRMVQKIEFLTDDLADQVQPTEVQLAAFYQERVDTYREPERRSFSHVYFNLDQRGDTAVEAAARVLAELRAEPAATGRHAALGDRFMLPHDFTLHSQEEVSRAFGRRFAVALFEIEPGSWEGPIASAYGLHLGRVTQVVEARVPDLASIRNSVLRDYAAALRAQANDALLASVRSRYEVEIDEDAIKALSLRQDSRGASR